MTSWISSRPLFSFRSSMWLFTWSWTFTFRKMALRTRKFSIFSFLGNAIGFPSAWIYDQEPEVASFFLCVSVFGAHFCPNRGFRYKIKPEFTDLWKHHALGFVVCLLSNWSCTYYPQKWESEEPFVSLVPQCINVEYQDLYNGFSELLVARDPSSNFSMKGCWSASLNSLVLGVYSFYQKSKNKNLFQRSKAIVWTLSNPIGAWLSEHCCQKWSSLPEQA